MNKFTMIAALLLASTPAFAGMEKCDEVELSKAGKDHILVHVGRPMANDKDIASTYWLKTSVPAEKIGAIDVTQEARACEDGAFVKSMSRPHGKYNVVVLALPKNEGEVEIVSCSSQLKRCFSATWDPTSAKPQGITLVATQPGN